MNWNELLSNHMARDYVFIKEPYTLELAQAKKWISEADCILIGAGSGLSTAAGMIYSGPRFEENFQEFIQKYGSRNMPDMYSAGFYPFPDEQSKWAFWAKYALINVDNQEPLELYTKLFDLVKRKEYFVYTTNVDEQFIKAGFAPEKIFATQGSYGLMQCAKKCHNTTYPSIKLFRQMEQATRDCKIPAYLVPKCPVCGGKMSMNLRADDTFVEDENWHQALNRYVTFLKKNRKKKIVLLELGVGFNTPVIIRFPFEDLLRENKQARLIRMNKDQAFVSESQIDQCAGIDKDMNQVIEDLLEK